MTEGSVAISVVCSSFLIVEFKVSPAFKSHWWNVFDCAILRELESPFKTFVKGFFFFFFFFFLIIVVVEKRIFSFLFEHFFDILAILDRLLVLLSPEAGGAGVKLVRERERKRKRGIRKCFNHWRGGRIRRGGGGRGEEGGCCWLHMDRHTQTHTPWLTLTGVVTTSFVSLTHCKVVMEEEEEEEEEVEEG